MSLRHVFLQASLCRLTAGMFVLAFSISPTLADEVKLIAKNGDAVNFPGDANQYTLAQIRNPTGAVSVPAAAKNDVVGFNAKIAGPGISSTIDCIIRSVPSGSSYVHTAVACVGRPAIVSNPTSNPNAVFRTFGNPDIDDYGCLTFSGTVSVSGSSQTRAGYWGTCSSTIVGAPQFLESGTVVPGTTGTQATLTEAIQPKLAHEPTLLFSSSLTGSAIPQQTSVRGKASPGLLQLLACPACIAPVPGEAAISFGADTQRIVGDSGAAAVYGSLVGASVSVSNNSAIWAAPSGEASSLRMIARLGSPAAGMPGWAYTSLIGNASTRPKVTNQGAVIFSARVSDPTAQPTYGIWIANPGSAQPILLARGDQEAPGVGAGAVLGILPGATSLRSIFGGDLLPNQSQSPVTFVSNMYGGTVASANSRALWQVSTSSPGSAPLLLGRGGSPAPETDPTTSFLGSSFGSQMIGNRKGDVGIFVELQGPNVSSTNNFAYYVTRNGSLHLVAREGQEIPGTGLTIVDLNIQPQMYMNDLGQFVFYALLSPDGGLANTNFAYVGADESGSLRILMMPSLQLHPSNGPAAYLGGVTMNPRSILSDAGKVVMGGVVTETSGFTEGLFSIYMTPPVVQPPQCPADFNSDGQCTLDDLFSFLNALFAQDSQADFNHDGNVTNQDLFDFIGAWFEGCP